MPTILSRPVGLLSALALYLATAAAQGNVDTEGQWGELIQFPLIPVAAAVIPGRNHSTQLFTYSAYSDFKFGAQNGRTQSAWLDLETGDIRHAEIAETGHDMFCPGMTSDVDGKIFVTGGQNAEITSIYDFQAQAWTRGPDMVVPRGYQSSCITSNGDIFQIGGSFTGGIGGQDAPLKDGEIYRNGQWELLPGAKVDQMLTTDREGPWRTDNHAWLYGWRDGYVFQAGPSSEMNWYDTNGEGGVQGAGVRTADGTDQMCAPNVMYDDGKILSVGGAQDYTESEAFAMAHVIEIDEPNQPAIVREVAPMANRRALANAVVLPDGQVLVTGGQTRAQVFTNNNAILAAESWNPATEEWTTLAAEQKPRNYHSVSILLPDGTVFSGGGGLCWDGGICDPAADHPDGQIFSPPYLFRDGQPAPRPVISDMSFGENDDDSFAVPMNGRFTAVLQDVPEGDATFSLVRLGSVTHSVNTDQRRIALTPTEGADGRYTFQLSGASGALAPGFWYFFAIVDGVPSISRTIQVMLG